MMENFKTQLTEIVGTMIWSPSDLQLTAIAKGISKLGSQDLTPANIREIIRRACPGVLFYTPEGVDNSSLNTALLMAIQAAAKKLAAIPKHP